MAQGGEYDMEEKKRKALESARESLAAAKRSTHLEHARAFQDHSWGRSRQRDQKKEK